MLNKNDPLIGAVQEVMKRNQAEREAARLVNEKFGVTDRKALPHERLGEWDAAYKTVLTEGVEALDEETVSTKLDLTDHGSPIHAKHEKEFGITIKHPEDGKGKSTVSGPKKGMQGYLNRVYDTGASPRNAHPHVFSETALDEKVKMSKGDIAALRHPKKKITSHDFAALRAGEHKMEEDVTSPSSMGIKGPDYATGTPAYANKGPQMVNRAAKTSLPAGTVAKSIKEAADSASSMPQVRGQTTYGNSAGTSAMTGMPRRSAPADRAGTSAMTGMPTRSAPADRVGTSAITGMPSRSASTRQASTGAQIGGARPSPSVGGNAGALARQAAGQRTSNAIRNLNTPGLRKTNTVNAAGQAKGPNVGLPQKSTIASTGQKVNAAAQTRGPNAASGAAPKPAAKAPVPTAKPVKPAAVAKPKIVAKPKATTGAATPAVKKTSTAQRAYIARQRDRQGP